jgi:transposase
VSPDYKPIELAWSKMKTILKKLKARTYDTLISGIAIALEQLSENDISGWFKHCGYSL